MVNIISVIGHYVTDLNIWYQPSIPQSKKVRAVEHLVTDLTQGRNAVTLQWNLHRIATRWLECRNKASPYFDSRVIWLQHRVDMSAAILIGHRQYKGLPRHSHSGCQADNLPLPPVSEGNEPLHPCIVKRRGTRKCNFLIRAPNHK